MCSVRHTYWRAGGGAASGGPWRRRALCIVRVRLTRALPVMCAITDNLRGIMSSDVAVTVSQPSRGPTPACRATQRAAVAAVVRVSAVYVITSMARC